MHWKRIALMAAIAVALAFPALAQRPTPARRGPCRQDIQKLCAAVQPGGGRIAQCLGQHEAQLSPACKHHRQSQKARRERVHKACQSDIEKFCKDVKPGGGAIHKCLRQHEAELAPPCGAALGKARAKRKARTE